MTVSFVRYLSARALKIVGNASKAFSFLFYNFYPQKRFSIPHRSKPLLRVRNKHRIPKVIWQTNYTDQVTIAVYLNYLVNRLMAPTYEYRFMDPGERAAFISRYYPEIFATYSSLMIGAAQADLWRVLVLRHYGGVYLDIDAHLGWPLGFAIDRGADELYVRHREGELTNYFLASVKENGNLDLVIDHIMDNIATISSNDVAELTGPSVLQHALGPLDVPATSYKQLCYQGSFTNEFFQYVDHPQGKWTRVQKTMSIIDDGASR